MPLALVAMSHSPLLEFSEPPAELTAEVAAAFGTARRFVEEFDPTLVVSFAPDHYNGFFYELMPPFCVGAAATGIGDYGTAAGPLRVPGDLARDLTQWILDEDVDIAMSLQMEIDHGAVQPLEILLGGIDSKPVIPIFINSVAAPFAPVRRIRRLGEAVGRYLAGLDERVLIIGSGGLSHDPPVPRLDTATEQQRAMILNGRHPSPEARAVREQRVIAAAKAFSLGDSDIMDLNPAWDREVLSILGSGRLDPFDAWTADGMAESAGNSAHEVRTWIAAYSALLAGAGSYEITSSYYRPIREFIAGFAVTTALPVAADIPA
jgi:2,3-dihydroxyphenylpropionate 1,2-dioxygenase